MSLYQRVAGKSLGNTTGMPLLARQVAANVSRAQPRLPGKPGTEREEEKRFEMSLMVRYACDMQYLDFVGFADVDL